MKIKKIGHCCLVVEEGALKILTDPGVWSTRQNEEKNIDVVLITHEHADHLHVEPVKKVLENNPEAKIYTVKGVGKILDAENIKYELLEHGQSVTVKNILIEAFGEKHAVIYPGVPQVDNTGYFIANRFFYPGDVFFNPGKPVEILALPVAGPWVKMAEALDYGKEIKPKYCFPVHDGMLKIIGPFHILPEKFLGAEGIEFSVIEIGQEKEF